jgi:hypothetical protein
MIRRRLLTGALAGALAFTTAGTSLLVSADTRFAVPPPGAPEATPAPPPSPTPTPAPTPPIQVTRGRAEPDQGRPLRWLLAAQNDSGGWGEGLRTQPDVATTAISALALLRLEGSSVAGAERGQPRRAVTRAIEYIVAAAERAPEGEIAIERPNTQPQRKLGRFIDTFVGAQFLAEALEKHGKQAHISDVPRTRKALQNLVARIERAQRPDGSYQVGGWAPVLSSAFANEGLEAAERAGAKVNVEVLAKGDRYMLNNYNPKSRSFDTRAAAGVGLYAVAGAAKSAVRAKKTETAAGRAALAHLNDDRFVRGFGSYGGEEHVSYMLTTEALAKTGGKAWAAWSGDIRRRLAVIQRPDGTWRGDHCITSTTFCTAASLITLAIHRA